MSKYKNMNTIEPVAMKTLLSLNLQEFADDPPADPPVVPPADPPPADPPPAIPPTKVEFTAEQQAELNRILSEKLAKERAKQEKEYNDKLAAAKTEAEKLAAMNAEQKADYEREKREADIAKRESEITRRELRATALETLADKGLPKALADILVFTDADSTKSSLDAVEKSFRTAVEEEVNKRLKGSAPGGGGYSGSGEKNPFSKEHWNLTEQGKLFNSDPKRYEMLKAQAKK